MENVIKNLRGRGIKFVDNGDWEYDRFILKLRKNGDVFLEDVEEGDFSRNLGKKDVISFLEKGVELGVFEFVGDGVVYYDMESDYLDDFLN